MASGGLRDLQMARFGFGSVRMVHILFGFGSDLSRIRFSQGFSKGSVSGSGRVQPGFSEGSVMVESHSVQSGVQ